MKQITTQEALTMLASAFDEPVDKLTADRARDTIDGWDSMGALALMADLDTALDILLTAEESRAMTRIGDVLAFLRDRGALTD